MKKAAAILLLFIYAFSATGFAVKADYCCSNLKSVKLVLADGAKDKGGCCKVQYHCFKVKDIHSAANVLLAPALHFTFLHTLNESFSTNHLSAKGITELRNIHSPPLLQTPVYIFNCIFRI